MYLDEFYNYKEQLMKDLLTNEQVVKLINPNIKLSDAKELMYTQVFPCEYIPDTIEEGKTYICCDVDVDRIGNSRNNKTFLVAVLYIWVFTHKSTLWLPEHKGVRTDKICSEIDKKLNGSAFYTMGQLNLYNVSRISPLENFQGKCLIYDGIEINKYHNYNKEVPSNRRTGK